MKKNETFNIGLNGCYSDCANCLSESKCCSCFDKINLPVLNKNEIINIEKYTKNDDFYVALEKNIFSLKTLNDKCIFYKNGKCLIYRVRPTDCQLFPYDIIKVIKNII